MSQSPREGVQRGNLNPPPTTPKPNVAPSAQGAAKSNNKIAIDSLRRTLHNALLKLDSLEENLTAS